MTCMRTSILTILIIFLAACGGADPARAIVEVTVTLTPDPCLSQNMNQTVKPVNDLQREFNDASELAKNLPREQLQPSISEMQRLRRAAEDQAIPACLETLKMHQLAHMNSVIDTLIAFVGGADADTLSQGLAKARNEYDQYTFEMASLLGVTLIPATETTTPEP